VNRKKNTPGANQIAREGEGDDIGRNNAHSVFAIGVMEII
jgi:hypothetical protein